MGRRRTKAKVHSIRLSPDIEDMIDRQVGDNWTDKFQRLVTRAMWEVPAAEQELVLLEEKARCKRLELEQLSDKVLYLGKLVHELDRRLSELYVAINESHAFEAFLSE